MADMTISQALRSIKKLKGRLGEHLSHAHGAVTHLSTEQPAFAFATCLEQAIGVRKEMLAIETAVANANARVMIEWEGASMPLTFAVRFLAELKSQIAWIKSLPVRAQAETFTEEQTYDYESSKHINVKKAWTCHLPEAKRVDATRELQDRFDKLNDIVETTNHKTTI